MFFLFPFSFAGAASTPTRAAPMAAERHPERMRIDRSRVLTGSLSSPEVLPLPPPPTASPQKNVPAKKKARLGNEFAGRASQQSAPATYEGFTGIFECVGCDRTADVRVLTLQRQVAGTTRPP